MKPLRYFHSNAVWPSPLLVGLFVVLYGLVAACLWLIELVSPSAGQAVSEMREILNIRSGIILGAAGLYAAYRLWRFHPACNQAYAAWLKLSPWTADKPLPMGPIHLVWQDVIVIGALTAIAAWHVRIDSILPLAVFGLVYLIGMTLLLAFTRRWWSCLVLGFLWPTLILPATEGMPAVIIVAVIIAVIGHGHRKSLRAFPWEFLTNSNRPAGSIFQREIRIEVAPAIRTLSNVGWPYGALSPKIQSFSVSTRTSICLSALMGWWTFCLIKCLNMEPLPEFIAVFAVCAALVRLVIYCSGVANSFNLWGRIASGRIVVPGFDKVFLTPLAVVVVAIFGGMAIRRSGSSYAVVESLVMTAIWHLLFWGGPTLRHWFLTGQHRFRPPARSNANKQLLRPV